MNEWKITFKSERATSTSTSILFSILLFFFYIFALFFRLSIQRHWRWPVAAVYERKVPKSSSNSNCKHEPSRRRKNRYLHRVPHSSIRQCYRLHNNSKRQRWSRRRLHRLLLNSRRMNVELHFRPICQNQTITNRSWNDRIHRIIRRVRAFMKSMPIRRRKGLVVS